jgi:hypothetical protein
MSAVHYIVILLIEKYKDIIYAKQNKTNFKMYEPINNCY